MSAAVLLPGLDGTGALLNAFAQTLGAALTTKIISYPTEIASSYAELERVARAALPTDKPYVLIGESFSGPIAISLAASAPAGLRGLVLCATFARSPLPALRPFAPLLQFAPTRLPTPLLRHLLLGRWTTPLIERLLQAALDDIPPDVLRKRVAEVLQVDVSSQLRSIGVPVMYLRAAQDRLVPAASSDYLRQILSSIEIVDVEGPHFLLQTVPEICAEKILGFAKQVGLQLSNNF